MSERRRGEVLSKKGQSCRETKGGLGQLLEMGSGLIGGLTEPCSPSYPHAVLVPVQPDASRVLEPICNWFLSLHLQKPKSSTRREF